jgi:putative membrane protein
MMDNWGGYGMTYGNPWAGLISFLFMGLFMAALVVGVIFLLRRTPRPTGHGQSAEVNALDLANQRYAKGEITREEYQTIKKDIS